MKKLFSLSNKTRNYKKQCKNGHGGFSLFELIIYIAILSGLMVTSSNMFISLSKGHGQSSAKSEVNSAIRFVTELIRQDIKNASEVSVPLSVGSEGTLTLTRDGEVITYDVLGGSLRRKEGEGISTSLTGPNISVGTPSFTRIENKNLIFDTTNVGIKAEMVFSYNSTSPDWNYSATLKTTVNLTSDGILSFMGNLVSTNDLIAETGTKTVSTDWSLYDNVYINNGVTVTFESGTHDLGAANLIVNSGGKIISLSSSQTVANATGVNIITVGNITVNSGGSINADEKGYLATYGPGAGTTSTWGGSGASFGGQGGLDYVNSAKPATYGSESSPTALGSGGGKSAGYAGNGNGSSGGGSIKLVAKNLINNGSISSNAGSGERMGGAGSGGSIWIDVVNLTGSNTGIFSSNGGSNIFILGADERCTGSGGGGGRISLNSSGTDTYAGSIIVSGGDGIQGGEAGTIARNVVTLGNIVIASGVVTWTRGIHTFNNMTVNPGAVLTTGAAQGRSVKKIGAGLGGGPAQYWGGVGGGHGGAGGYSYGGGSQIVGGIAYNTGGNQVSEPDDLGSGGSGSSGVNALGGYGGGAIKIVTTGNLTNNGNINADGQDLTLTRAGAGSGGSLWFVVSGVLSSTDGIFSAKGGDANVNNGQTQGGGGGGRISFSYGSTSFSGENITVSGGLSFSGKAPYNGVSGTINGL